MTETCKFCWETGDPDTMLSPCACKGTMKYVHDSCLRLWVNTSNSNLCDICFASLPVPPVTRGCPFQREDEQLPVSLKFAIATMWFYTGMVLLLPFFIRHLERRAL